MISNLYITTHQALTSQLLSFLLAHEIILHVNVRSRSPYFWRHCTPTSPGFEFPPRMMDTLLEVIVDRWIGVGIIDMVNLTLVGDELRDRIVALVDSLLLPWVFGLAPEKKLKDERCAEDLRGEAKQMKIEEEPRPIPTYRIRRHRSRLPLPRARRRTPCSIAIG